MSNNRLTPEAIAAIEAAGEPTAPTEPVGDNFVSLLKALRGQMQDIGYTVGTSPNEISIANVVMDLIDIMLHDRAAR